MKNRRTVRLRVEELESRLVPSAGTPWPYPTGNWSGFSVDAAAGAVSDVKGSWNVPSVTVSGSGTKYAASWLGIDGDISNTVEQIGTDSDQIGGKAYYYAWYEMYPSNYFYVDWATGKGLPASNTVPAAALVGVGDTISADVQFLSVSKSVSTFQLTITDSPAAGGLARTFSTTQTIKNAARSSAEWIVEQTGPLTKFSPETFTNAQATIKTTSGPTTGTIGTFLQGDSSTVVYKINIVNNQGTTLDSTSELNSTGDGFTVYYGPTLPSSPSGGVATHGPMERLTDFQVAAAVAPPGSGSSQAVVEISPTTPTNQVLATEAIIQTGFRLTFSHAEGALGRSGVVVGVLAIGEGNLGAGLSRFGRPPVPGTAVPLAVTPVQGKALAGERRFESSAEPFATVWSAFAQPAMAPPAALAISEDVHIDRLLGALALVTFLPQLPKAKVEPARARRLQDGNDRRE